MLRRKTRCNIWPHAICSFVVAVVLIQVGSFAETASPEPNWVSLDDGTVLQPVHEYTISFEENWGIAEDGSKTDLNPFRFYTHLGSDYGRMGPSENKIRWNSEGHVEVSNNYGWCGMWHSLEGVARDKSKSLDFLRCYPSFIREEYQPQIVGILIRLKGKGRFKVELKSPDERLLFVQSFWVSSADFTTYEYQVDPERFRQVKFFNWVCEPGANISIDWIRFTVKYPDIAFAKRVTLLCYSKIARCYAPEAGIVRDRANWPAGDFDNVPTSGLFSLATAAAWKMGFVTRDFAVETLREIHSTIAKVQKAKGLLPHFIRQYQEGYRIHHETEFSTVDTGIYYHGMLLASQILEDQELQTMLMDEIRQIDFGALYVDGGFISHGLADDGQTLILSYWRDFGGETALVLLLEYMAVGREAKLKMDNSGKVFNGVGFIPEIQSLFYPQFDRSEPDNLTGIDWRKVRTDLLGRQMTYFDPNSLAGQTGIYGLSAGEGYRGVGYVANGVDLEGITLIHPHYMLLSALSRECPPVTYQTLRICEERGLLPPWGLVENIHSETLEYLPMLGSLNAAFEAISAYHLWANANGERDIIYWAARQCPVTEEAIRVFYSVK